MTDVDPFAGIDAGGLPEGVQPGSLEGVNYDVPGTEPSGEAPPAYAPAQVEVQAGSLTGDGEPASDEELAELAAAQEAELNEAWSQAGDPDPTPESDPTPEPVAASDSAEPTTSEPSGESSPTIQPDGDGTAEQSNPVPPKRSRRRRAAPAPEPEPEPVKEPAKLKMYLFFKEGELDNGEPFWFIEHTESAATQGTAIAKLWRRLEKPDTFEYHVVEQKDWRKRSVTVEEVPQPPVRKVVVH